MLKLMNWLTTPIFINIIQVVGYEFVSKESLCTNVELDFLVNYFVLLWLIAILVFLNRKREKPGSLLTFLIRCNTDVASLLSETALKSMIAYFPVFKTGNYP